jgi:putative transposase
MYIPVITATSPTAYPVAKDAEILALRHQVMVLERQLRGEKVRFTPADRAFLAALLHRLPRAVLRRVRLLVRPETVLRWHRDLLARRHARVSRPTAGHPTVRSIGCWCCGWENGRRVPTSH